MRAVAVAVWQTVWACYLAVFMEWLFLATQQGFMVSFSLGEWVTALAGIPLALLMVAAAGLVPLLALDALLDRVPGAMRLPPWWRMAPLVPALILTGLAFLLLDNFTYTLFGIGVVTTPPERRFLYALLLVVVFVALLRYQVRERARMLQEGRPGRWLVIPLVLVAASAATVTAKAATRKPAPEQTLATAKARLPNILFLAADGVEARRMSSYGYPRPTTPFLEQFKERTLFFENAFSNAGRTTGSLTSMLNSRLPTATKVIFPPHILSEDAAFEHLPGLLHRAGYRTFQFTVRYYADGPDLNMQAGFEHANGRDVSAEVPESPWRQLMAERYIAERISERLSERTLYVFGLRPMVNYFKLVQLPTRIFGEHSDTERIDQAIAAIDQTSEPFFMHVHLMGTHCCEYQRRPNPVFARSESPTLQDLVDDTILEADRNFERLLTHLERKGLLENTLVVVSSDHTMGWNTLERVPLMIHFPGGANRGVVKENAQLLDVTPTVLEAVGLPIPEWMEGRSLLSSRRSSTEPILSTGQIDLAAVDADWESIHQLGNAGPPLYGLSTVSAVICDRWLSLEVTTGRVAAGAVWGHTAPCPPDSFPTVASVRQHLLDHLRERGFEVAATTP